MTNIRTAGKKLVFIDTIDDEYPVQHVVNLGRLRQKANVDEARAQVFLASLTPNSYISM